MVSSGDTHGYPAFWVESVSIVRVCEKRWCPDTKILYEQSIHDPFRVPFHHDHLMKLCKQ